MTPVKPEMIESAIEIIGAEDISDEEIESQVLNIAGDEMLARRLIDWLPEIFGSVVVAHLGDVNFVDTFSAKTASGKWKDIPMKAEPIFVQGIKIAQDAYHSNWTENHKRLSLRSAVLNSVNNLLNEGGSVDGATTSGPALIGIPAEVYRSELPLFRRLLW